MQRTKPYLKVAAIVSAVTLAGTFVAYRAGAVPNPFAAEPQPEAPPPEAQIASEQPASTDPKPPAVMHGSKWGPAFLPADPNPTTVTPVPPGGEQSPVFMAGSKSFRPVMPRPQPGTGAQSASPPPTTSGSNPPAPPRP